jgi:xeroderma pigmentosum group C-complementing protein
MSHNIPDPESLSVDNVLDTSAANVEGYLRNALRRNRHVSAGEGGRGTKVNRNGAVTSADHRTLEAFKAAAAGAGPDGKFTVKQQSPSDVGAPKHEVPSSAAAIAPTTVKREFITTVSSTSLTGDTRDIPFDVDALAGSTGTRRDLTHDDDDEVWEAIDIEESPQVGVAVKHQPGSAESAAAGSSAMDNKWLTTTDGVDVTGARAAGAPVSLDGLHEGDDPSHAPTLWEMREAAKARRWAEKNALFAQCVSAFMLYVAQARRLYRASRHPALAEALMKVKRAANAVQRAQDAIDNALAAEARKRNDMTPAWVSLGKDATGTSTGAACQELVAGVASLLAYRYDAQRETAVPQDREGLLVVGDNDDGGDAPRDAPASQSAGAAGGGANAKRGPPRIDHTTGPSPVGAWLRDNLASLANDKDKLDVPNPVHFTVAFVALAAKVGLRCRLCSAFSTYEAVPRESRINGADEAFSVPKGGKSAGFVGAKLDATSAISAALGLAAPATGRGRKSAKATAADAAAAQTEANNKKAQSPFWVEVWCPVKRIWFSVNPCPTVTTRWGAPYAIACGGDHVVDVTPRYVSAWSSVFKQRIDEMHYTTGFLWADELATKATGSDSDDDANGPRVAEELHAYRCTSTNKQSKEKAERAKLLPIQRVLWPLCQDVGAGTEEMLEREVAQLTALKYSEPLPTTLQDLKGHPLFVTEEAITRYEAIYPKTGNAVVGYIRGKPVFRRDCVHPLRSRQGWLRVGRMVHPPDEPPYRLVPPPPSRPLVAHSQMYGRWQTVAFKPSPLNADGTIPRFENTSWYMMLSGTPGAGLSHLNQPNVAAAARRMRCEFAVAVAAFVKEKAGQEREPFGRGTASSRDRRADASNKLAAGGRSASRAPAAAPESGGFPGRFGPTNVFVRTKWSPKFDGIVVPSSNADAVLRAYDEFMALKAKAEADKRRHRAMRWWRVFIQHALARLRIQADYAAGDTQRGGRRRGNALPRASLHDL